MHSVFRSRFYKVSTMELQQAQNDARQRTLVRLVGAAQRGDRQAFGRLIERYERAVYGTVFRRLGNHAEAQEVCQEVFIQALEKIGQLRDPRCFGGWLRAIAGRMAINRAVRTRRGAAAGPQTVETACFDRQTPLVSILARERENQVRLGLGRLRALDRETLVAFYFDGRSLVEMSDQFHTPVGTIKRRLHVARKRLARELAALAPA
jgi:RNA polymerase sigma-70 factor (ECF subfamily)